MKGENMVEKELKRVNIEEALKKVSNLLSDRALSLWHALEKSKHEDSISSIEEYLDLQFRSIQKDFEENLQRLRVNIEREIGG
jgi:hypothetical protein